jgi:Helix-turn-helix domain
MSLEERLDILESKLGILEKIEAMLNVLVERQRVREWYSTDEFAQMVGKAEFTVREWCRHGRIHAEKRMSGRGAFPAWVISHQEVLRYQREGLLPLRRRA